MNKDRVLAWAAAALALLAGLVVLAGVWSALLGQPLPAEMVAPDPEWEGTIVAFEELLMAIDALPPWERAALNWLWYARNAECPSPVCIAFWAQNFTWLAAVGFFAGAAYFAVLDWRQRGKEW